MTGQLPTSTSAVPQQPVSLPPAAGQLQFVDLYEPSTDYNISYIRSISAASVTPAETYNHSVVAASSATAAMATVLPPVPIPAGMEDEVDEVESLWGFQPSTQSGDSHRPWMSSSRFLSADIGTQLCEPPTRTTRPKPTLSNALGGPHIDYPKTWNSYRLRQRCIQATPHFDWPTLYTAG